MLLRVFEGPPFQILYYRFRITPFVFLKPKAIPIEIPLQGRKPSLRVVWLVDVIWVVVQSRWFGEMRHGCHDFKRRGKNIGQRLSRNVLDAFSKDFHEKW